MLQIRKFFSILRKVSKKRPLQNSLTKNDTQKPVPEKSRNASFEGRFSLAVLNFLCRLLLRFYSADVPPCVHFPQPSQSSKSSDSSQLSACSSLLLSAFQHAGQNSATFPASLHIQLLVCFSSYLYILTVPGTIVGDQNERCSGCAPPSMSGGERPHAARGCHLLRHHGEGIPKLRADDAGTKAGDSGPHRGPL